MCEKLGLIVDAILFDLAAAKHKMNQGRNSIWRMEEQLANKHVQKLTAFTSENGPLIQQLVERAAYNECALRCIAKYAKQCGNRSTADNLCSQVKKLQEDNDPRKTFASILLELLKKLNSRIQAEEEWTLQFSAYLQSLLGKILDVSSETGLLEAQVLQLKDHIDEIMLGEVSSSALYKVMETLESLELRLKNAIKKFRFIYAELNSSKGIFNGKIRYLSRVAGHQQFMKETFTEINPKLVEIHTEIAKILDMYDLSVEAEAEHDDPNQYEEESLNAEDYAFKSFKAHSLDLCFSWRTRLFRNRPILPPVRVQSGATCSYYATLTAVESLYKREYAAYPTIQKDYIGQPDEFIINLSRHQLEDIVEHFYATQKTKLSKRLNVCLEKMKSEGVGSEESYADSQVQAGKRYRIKEYEEICLEPEEIEVQRIMRKPVSDRRRKKLLARHKRGVVKKNVSEVIESHLLEGKVLIANFFVTTEYFRLLPHQIYRVPKRNAKYEVTKAGNPLSHCVVVVGFGVRDGEIYLIFQNSYGKTWGDGGFGRIYVDSVRKLFTARV